MLRRRGEGSIGLGKGEAGRDAIWGLLGRDFWG